MSNVSISNDNIPQIIMLDNLDSFTYNLVDEFYQLGFAQKSTAITLKLTLLLSNWNKLETMPYWCCLRAPVNLESWLLNELISKAAGRFPMLGICLGHQALIEHYGGRVGRAPEIVHGKSSNVSHCGQGAFVDIQQPLPVARYHSLVALEMPEQLTVTAKVNELVMAIEHPQDAALGFQFHPESILTTYGSNLLKQAIEHLIQLKRNNQKAKDNA